VRVRVSAGKTTTLPPIQPNELASQKAVWSEFKYRVGSEIFGEAEPADYVYQIRQGSVRTYKLLSDGRRQIGAFHLPGDIFGIEECEFHRFTADAIVNTTVWIAKRRSLFGGLGDSDISVTNNVRDLINKSLEHAENHLLLLGRQTALEKVAAFLLEMDRRLDQPEVMALPMGRRDIADYLGLTLETVSRALSALRKESILSFVGQTQRVIVLHDRSRLAQRATSSFHSKWWCIEN
jgi:CRP/FNR family transcriptional regulator, nitrogen fixation regulation protein